MYPWAINDLASNQNFQNAKKILNVVLSELGEESSDKSISCAGHKAMPYIDVEVYHFRRFRAIPWLLFGP
jgi:hypothetical protein